MEPDAGADMSHTSELQWPAAHGFLYANGTSYNAGCSYQLPSVQSLEFVSGLGSFGQLLSQASAGSLYQCGGDIHQYAMDPLPASHIDDTQQYEGYEAGEDSTCSEDDGDDPGASVDEMFSEGGESSEQSIGGDEDSEQLESSLQVIDDNIPEEMFRDRPITGIECEEGPRSIDDTVLCESEVESEDVVVCTGAQARSDLVGDVNGNECLLGGCGCAKKELAQEISKEYLASVQRGYSKRNRSPMADGPDCRSPRDMGAIEIAMRLAGQRQTEHIFEPVLGMVFDSPEEGYEFFNMYSWEAGFGIVKNRCRKRQSDHTYRSMQELCCEKSGIDRRVNGSTKKVQCPARMKMLRGDDGGWYVSELHKEHNHPFAESCSEKREWFSHKRLDPYTLGIIRYLCENNVNQTRVRCIVGSMFGSLKGAPCTKRTIRTICSQIAREQMDDDVAKTMELFKKMKSSDPEFQWSVETTMDSRINSLMWCSGKSREQYACFGDVVTFDTTYCTNFYKMPFGLFVGVNNHFQTVVFGGVLMKTETTESFEWVFREFINLMGGKPPKTVLTDQCKAMTIALGRVWPDTFHTSIYGANGMCSRTSGSRWAQHTLRMLTSERNSMQLLMRC